MLPTAERTLDPARIFEESLTPRPELENDQDPQRTSRHWLSVGEPRGYRRKITSVSAVAKSNRNNQAGAIVVLLFEPFWESEA